MRKRKLLMRWIVHPVDLGHEVVGPVLGGVDFLPVDHQLAFWLIHSW
jgi:hypothetical protein